MLVLTRRVDERIVINGDITVTVLGVDEQNRVRLGVDAPADVSVNREEVENRSRKVNRRGS